MAGIIKSLIRVGVVGGLLTGGVVLVAGPQRVHAIGRQIQMKLMATIDKNIDDPIAMRTQLQGLEATYPKRIAEARSMLGELKEQIRQVNRDQSISSRVVNLAQADLNDMKDLLARAEQARDDYQGTGRQLVTISFNDRAMNLDEAYTQANRIVGTVASYQTRLNECTTELDQLNHDARQTESLLSKLQSEYTEFQMQLADLDRKIDTVARKERMVKMVADRQHRINQLSRYKAASLDQFKSNLASRVAELDARMEALTGREDQVNYEERAKLQIDTEASAKLRFERSNSQIEAHAPNGRTIIESSDDVPTAPPVKQAPERIAIR
jgi:chromosome segregation ATPase